MPDAPSLAKTTTLYCTFWLRNQCFGIPASMVSEVHAPVPLTSIPGGPPAVQGYVNLRGQLVLVLDPRVLLFGEPQSDPEFDELIVFQADVGEACALAVERVGEIVPITPSQIHVRGSSTDDVDLSSDLRRARKLITGHATLDSQLVMLIAATELLEAAFAETI